MELIISILISVFTGLYSGLIVVKYSEFRNLREEAARELLSGKTAQENADQLSLIAASLSRLKHRRSAEKLREISNQYRQLRKASTIFQENGEVSLPTVNEARCLIDRNTQLQLAVRLLMPSWLSLIFPF